MLPNTSLISCNYSALPSIPLETPKCRALPCRSLVRRNCNLIPAISFLETVGPCISKPTISSVGRRAFHICRSTSNSKHTDGTGEAGGGGGGVEGRDWTTSFLLFVLWAGLMYYVFNLSPNQTPVSIWIPSNFLWVSYFLYFVSFIYSSRMASIPLISTRMHLFFIMSLWLLGMSENRNTSEAFAPLPLLLIVVFMFASVICWFVVFGAKYSQCFVCCPHASV